MEKFNDMRSQLEYDPFLSCADILLGDQLIHNKEEDNGGITKINLCAAGKSYNVHILVTEKECRWSRDLHFRANSSIKYSHDP